MERKKKKENERIEKKGVRERKRRREKKKWKGRKGFEKEGNSDPRLGRRTNDGMMRKNKKIKKRRKKEIRRRDERERRWRKKKKEMKKRMSSFSIIFIINIRNDYLNMTRNFLSLSSSSFSFLSSIESGIGREKERERGVRKNWSKSLWRSGCENNVTFPSNGSQTLGEKWGRKKEETQEKEKEKIRRKKLWLKQFHHAPFFSLPFQPSILSLFKVHQFIFLLSFFLSLFLLLLKTTTIIMSNNTQVKQEERNFKTFRVRGFLPSLSLFLFLWWKRERKRVKCLKQAIMWSWHDASRNEERKREGRERKRQKLQRTSNTFRGDRTNSIESRL